MERLIIRIKDSRDPQEVLGTFEARGYRASYKARMGILVVFARTEDFDTVKEIAGDAEITRGAARHSQN